MSATALLEVVTSPPSAKHTATVIFVHGLHASGHAMQQLLRDIRQDQALAQVKWVFPQAPSIPVFGQTTPAWFNMTKTGFDQSEMDKVVDEEGVLASRRALDALIAAEVDAGIPAGRIVLGGFSQGGATTAMTGLASTRQLAGIAVLSGWAPIRPTLQQMLSDHYKTLPIFWGHGMADGVIRYEVGTASRDWLYSVGVKDAPAGAPGLSFNAYPGLAHETSPQELNDFKAFLVKVLPGQ